jgi:hypothetical protein
MPPVRRLSGTFDKPDVQGPRSGKKRPRSLINSIWEIEPQFTELRLAPAEANLSCVCQVLQIGLGLQAGSSAVVTLSRGGPPRMGPQVLSGGAPKRRRPLTLLALEPLHHLLGAGAIQFFQSAYLPFFENRLQLNLLLQASQANRLQVLRRGGPSGDWTSTGLRGRF